MSNKNLPPELQDMYDELGLGQQSSVLRDPATEPAVTAEKETEFDLTKLPPLPHASLVWGETGVPKDYVVPEESEYFLGVFPKDGRPIVNFVGPPGAGKTTLVYYGAANWQNISPDGRRAAILHYNCRADDTPSSLIGTVGIRTAGSGFEDYLRHGPLYMAADIQNNNPDIQIILYFNEANYWRPAVQSVLNSIGDDVQAFYSSVTGERIETKGLKIVLDMNMDLAGTQQLNEALKDRFHTSFFDYLPEDDEIKIILSRTNVTKMMAKRMVKCLRAFRAAASGKKANSVPMKFDASPRLAIDAGLCMQYGMDPNKAWEEAVYGRAGHGAGAKNTRATLAELSKQCGFLITVR